MIPPSPTTRPSTGRPSGPPAAAPPPASHQGGGALAVRRAVAAATDAQLVRVVALLDALPDRGEADRLVAAARERLRALRPPRPLGFPRLLFAPLDGVVGEAVPSGEGDTAADPVLPRRAIAPLAAALRAALAPDLVAWVEAGLAGRTTDDLAAVAALGARLWPAAAARATRADVPPAPASWEEATGLSRPAFRALLDLCAPAWRVAPATWAALARREADPDTLARVALGEVARDGPGATAVALATLLRHADDPEAVARAAARGLPDALRRVPAVARLLATASDDPAA